MTVKSSAAEPLLERQETLDALAALTTAADDGTGAFVVIEGEGGIGKTSVLEHAARNAAVRGMTVLLARGSELEVNHPLGIVTTLFGSIVARDDAGQLLRGAAAPAASLFVPPSSPGAAVPMDLRTMLHALYWLTLNLGEQQPIFLAVDDAQWADEPSLEWVAYLAERIASAPVLMVAAMRPGETSERAIAERIRSHPRAERLALAPLSPEAVDHLIASTAPPLSGAQRDAIRAQSGGNPFYVVELVRAASHAGDGADAVPRSEPIQASVRRRLVDDDEGSARSVAEAIAILGDAASVRRVALLSQSTERDVDTVIRWLADREVLARDRLDFLHPIIRHAVIDELPTVTRSGLHREAARIVAETGGAPIEIATHLLEAEPDGSATTVEHLRDAARASMATGDAHGATRFLRRALDERPADGTLLLELADAEAAAGDPEAADRYERAISQLSDAATRARARRSQGLSLIQASRWRDAAKAFEAGLEDADSRDAELTRALESGYIASAYVGLADHAEADRRLADVLSSPLEDPASRELAAWSAFQQTLRMTGPVDAAAELALRAIDGGINAELVRSGQLIELVAGALVACGLLDQEVEMLDRGIEAARAINAHAKVGVYSYCRSIPHFLSGRLREAIADAETAVGVHESGWEVFYPGACAVLAWAQLERGEIESAAQAVAIDDAVWGERLDFAFLHRIARGQVAVARGDFEGGMAQFELVRSAEEALGVRSAWFWLTGGSRP